MKRTYISMATAILLGGVQAHAQHFVTTVEQANALVASPARVVQAAPGSIWRHKTGVHYTTKDNGATWTKIGDIAFSYDIKAFCSAKRKPMPYLAASTLRNTRTMPRGTTPLPNGLSTTRPILTTNTSMTTLY